MDTPNRVNETLTGEDELGVGGDMDQNAQFLAANFFGLAVGKDNFHALGIDFCATKRKGILVEPRVFGDVGVLEGFAAAQNRVDRAQ